MDSTPTRSTDHTVPQNLTPVRFLNSPAQKSSGNDSNFSACQVRLEQIIKLLQDNFTKWQLAQKRGLSLCQAIETIKTRCLEALSNTTGDNKEQYPKDLQTHCDKLAVIVSICSDITRDTKESLRQLQSLSKLSGSSNVPFYRTWQLPQFVKYVELLVNCYERETKIKDTVMHKLPHCRSSAELIRYTTAWEYPQHVDSYTQMCFCFLNEELGIHQTLKK